MTKALDAAEASTAVAAVTAGPPQQQGQRPGPARPGAGRRTEPLAAVAAHSGAAQRALVVSTDVSDEASVIASGPTVPDPTTCADALAILRRYNIVIPPGVQAMLERGALETPKPGDAVFARNSVHLIATPQQSLQAAAEAARALGLQATHGTLGVGRPANFVLWRVKEAAELAYWFGQRPVQTVVRQGRIAH